MKPDSRYIGDGVYIRDDGYQLVLTTGHHLEAEADNIVCLEDECVDGLLRFLEHARGLVITVTPKQGAKEA
jgi:hypothetical protein